MTCIFTRDTRVTRNLSSRKFPVETFHIAGVSNTIDCGVIALKCDREFRYTRIRRVGSVNSRAANARVRTYVGGSQVPLEWRGDGYN